MSATARLSLPYIAPLQAQKQYTYNAAMAVLDMLVQPAVISRTIAAPPATPDDGDAYIVGASATGAWAGKDGQFACWRDGAWAFRTPADGWLAYVNDDAELAVCQSGGWTRLVNSGGLTFDQLGINATADVANRLTVAADGTLLTHDGADHRLTLNKAASGDTASLLLQDDFSGRAEIGLAGDDDLHIKVSADGASWLEALSISRASGAVSLPQGQLAFPATRNVSSDPNTLDDYAEGSWTPALNFGGAPTGITYSSVLGRYTRIGRSVTVSGSFALSSKGSASGSATIAGLPFTAANDGLAASICVGHAAGLSAVSGAITGVIAANASRVTLYQSASGSGSTLSASNFSNSAQITFSATYDV